MPLWGSTYKSPALLRPSICPEQMMSLLSPTWSGISSPLLCHGWWHPILHKLQRNSERLKGHRLRHLFSTDLKECQSLGTTEIPSKDTGLVHHRGSDRVEVECAQGWEVADGHAILHFLAVRSARINRSPDVLFTFQGYCGR